MMHLNTSSQMLVRKSPISEEDRLTRDLWAFTKNSWMENAWVGRKQQPAVAQKVIEIIVKYLSIVKAGKANEVRQYLKKLAWHKILKFLHLL